MNPSGTASAKPRALFYAVAGILIAVQAVMFYMLPSPPTHVLSQPLTALPAKLGDWAAVRETPIAADVAAVLKADDTLNRDYVDTRGAAANLFIAYFGSQDHGRAPHSPQHCMPGAGWEPQVLTQVPVTVPSTAAPVRINRFILAKGNEQVVVHYWYEANKRVIASEYLAKIYLVWNSISYRRSDTSLVRVTVPVLNEGSRDRAVADGMRFVQACFEPVHALLE